MKTFKRKGVVNIPDLFPFVFVFVVVVVCFFVFCVFCVFFFFFFFGGGGGGWGVGGGEAPCVHALYPGMEISESEIRLNSLDSDRPSIWRLMPELNKTDAISDNLFIAWLMLG